MFAGIVFCLICFSFGFAATEKKEYVEPQVFLENSFKLAKVVFDSGFRPTFLIALWRGGAPVGMAVEEYFSYKHFSIEKHVAVRASAYDHDKLMNEVKVFDLNYVIENATRDDALLIVDDIVDTGSTIKKVLQEIKEKCGKNTPKDIRVAAVYFKPHKSSIVPDFYLYETSNWILFPHALEGLTIDEISAYQGPEVANLLM